MIRRHEQGRYPVSLMCRVLSVSRSGYGNPPTKPKGSEVEFSRKGGGSTCVSQSSATARS